MLNYEFESILANFCSPVLLKRKVSNLVSISKKELPDINFLIRNYNTKFEKLGIKIDTICECGERVLILVYQKNMMVNHLKNKFIAKILSDYGYAGFEDLNQHISLLRNKFSKSRKGDAFPHEIGIFLGYPLSDVIGFIKHKGKNYKHCGYWKVYQNLEAAQKTFALYDDLRSFTVNELENGKTIEEIIINFETLKNVA